MPILGKKKPAEEDDAGLASVMKKYFPWDFKEKHDEPQEEECEEDSEEKPLNLTQQEEQRRLRKAGARLPLEFMEWLYSQRTIREALKPTTVNMIKALCLVLLRLQTDLKVTDPTVMACMKMCSQFFDADTNTLEFIIDLVRLSFNSSVQG